MSLYKAKSFIGIFILLVYISMGIFGLFKFNHMSEIPMTNCPYIQNSYSVCENSLDHINNWRQFSNATISSLFIFLLLILGIILYFFSKQNFFNQKPYLFYKWKLYLDNKKPSDYLNKIIKWLSLLENSPSFLYVRHS